MPRGEFVVVIHSAYIANIDMFSYTCLRGQQKVHVTNKDTRINGILQC